MPQPLDRDGGGGGEVAEKPEVETPEVETPEVETPVVPAPKKPKNPKTDAGQTGGNTSGSDESSTSDDTATSDESGLDERIAETQDLAKTPFPPGAESPLPTSGNLVVIENGEIVEVTVTVLPAENGLMITGPDFTAEISTVDVDGSPLKTDEQGRVVLQAGTVLNVKVSGFAPNSIITLWLFSDPIPLGEFKVDANGEIDVAVALPEGVTLGEHTLQLNGVTANGELRTLNMSVVVTEEANVLQRNLLPTMIALMAAIALAGAVVARRRRSTANTDETVAQS